MNTKRFIRTLVLIAIGATLGTATTTTAKPVYNGGLSLDMLSFDSDSALAQGADDSGYGFGAELSALFSDRYVVNAGLGLVMMDDKASFEQDVVGIGVLNDGDRSTESSDIEGMSYFLEAGIRFNTPHPQKWTAGLNLGYQILDLERSIVNCSNCREEDVDLDGGLYIEPNIGYQYGAHHIELGYNYFFEDNGADGLVRLSWKVRWGQDAKPSE